MMGGSQKLDFGYSWVWIHGHVVPTIAFAGGVGIALSVGSPMWVWMPLAFLGVWAFAGLLISRLLIRIDQTMTLPSPAYAEEAGSVVDLGCGSGRTSIMIGRERPNAQITSVDNFSADYITEHGKAKTERNFKLAGIDGRATVEKGDLLDLPFDEGSFDAAVSSYAIDHLKPQEIPVALLEARRVLRDGGEFLLMVIVPNVWTAIAYSPVIFHAFRGRSYWRRVVREAGFALRSEGTSRGMAWFLLHKAGGQVPAPASSSEAVISKPAPRSFAAEVVRNIVESHLPSARFAAASLATMGGLVLAAAIMMQVLQGSVSWKWMAAVALFGAHVGVVMMLLGGAMRWLTGRRDGRQSASH